MSLIIFGVFSTLLEPILVTQNHDSTEQIARYVTNLPLPLKNRSFLTIISPMLIVPVFL
jgi:hypothetical protein